MRHFAIGDIHGCFKALTTLADVVRFAKEDVVITLGDYVNRGPDSAAAIDWLLKFEETGRLIPLRGNHECMMLAARESDESMSMWLECGGDATLASYAQNGETGRLAEVPEDHWQFLERTLPWHETETHVFVHANAYPDLSMAEQPDFMLYWEFFDSPAPFESGKIMVCGHTSQKNGVPLNIGHAVCIDTWACGRGWLTCLDIDSGKYWQANQRGQTRSGWLDQLQ